MTKYIRREGKEKVMTKNCAVNRKRSDQVVNLFAQTFTGTPNFNVQFWRQPTGNSALRTNLGTVQTTPGTDILRYNYIVQESDVDIDDFGATLTDACGSGTNSIEEFCTISLNPFTSITVTPATASVQINGTQSILAVCDSPICPTLTWSSDNVNVATVVGNGTSAVVTGHGIGNTTIKATSGTVVGAMVITVVALTSIDITPVNARIEVGGTQQLSAVCNAGTGVVTCPTLTWSSTDTNVATVDSNGLVTGIYDGTANIKATSGSITSNESVITVSTTSTSPIVEEAGLGTGGKIVIVGLAVGVLYMMIRNKEEKEK